MMEAAEFAKMKPTSLFVNTACAALVDEQALRFPLNLDQIFTAGLDVFREEQRPIHLWLSKHTKVLLHPRLGAFTPQGYEWIVAPGVDAVLRCLKCT